MDGIVIVNNVVAGGAGIRFPAPFKAVADPTYRSKAKMLIKVEPPIIVRFSSNPPSDENYGQSCVQGKTQQIQIVDSEGRGTVFQQTTYHGTKQVISERNTRNFAASIKRSENQARKENR